MIWIESGIFFPLIINRAWSRQCHKCPHHCRIFECRTFSGFTIDFSTQCVLPHLTFYVRRTIRKGRVSNKKIGNLQNLHNLTCWRGDHYTWHIFMYKILLWTFQKKGQNIYIIGESVQPLSIQQVGKTFSRYMPTVLGWSIW